MSEIDVSSEGGGGHKKGRGVKKAKKLSTREDMTPMVDLGFLLITFFIFTATMSTPTTMALNVPKKVDDVDKQIEIKESNAMTIMLGMNNATYKNVYWYTGQLKEDYSNFTTGSMAELREAIVAKRQEVIRNHQHDDKCPEIQAKAQAKGKKDYQNACRDKDFVVVIKPNKEASYGLTIATLDEMAINDVKAYAVIDITEDENKLLKATETQPR